MENGRFDVLPEQMAILCRRIDEEYDEDAIPEKQKNLEHLQWTSFGSSVFF